MQQDNHVVTDGSWNKSNVLEFEYRLINPGNTQKQQCRFHPRTKMLLE